MNLVMAIVALSMAVATPCTAQTYPSYPSKPIRLVMPQPPGGLVDSLTRGLAQRLAQKFNQSVTVENRTGGNQVIAANYVARSAPDGHTVLMTSDTVLSAMPLLMKDLPFDPYKDFALVTIMVESTSIFVAPAAMPVNTMRELVALAQAKPGALNYASFGNGTPPHLDMELFKKMVGLDLVHIPFSGVAPAITQMLGDASIVMFASIPAPLPYIKAGKLKALGIAGSRRSVLLPDVPTFAEAGYKFSAGGWFGLVVPAGTPAAIVNSLSFAVGSIIKEKEFADRFIINVGMEPIGNSPAEFTDYLREDRRQKAEKLRAAGAKID